MQCFAIFNRYVYKGGNNVLFEYVNEGGDEVKKFVSVVIVLVITLTFCTTVFADVDTYSIGSANYNNSLKISDTTATCRSSYFVGDENTVKVVITQSLEKQGFLWIWGKVAGEWSKTSNGSSTTLSNTVSGLSKGTYRVKTVFTVTDKYGETETVTVYSTTGKVG